MTAGTAHIKITGISYLLTLGADLRDLDGCFSLDLGLVDAVAHHRRRGRGRFGIDHRALLGGRISHDVELRRAGRLGAQSKCGEGAAHDKLLHGLPPSGYKARAFARARVHSRFERRVLIDDVCWMMTVVRPVRSLVNYRLAPRSVSFDVARSINSIDVMVVMMAGAEVNAMPASVNIDSLSKCGSTEDRTGRNQNK